MGLLCRWRRRWRPRRRCLLGGLVSRRAGRVACRQVGGRSSVWVGRHFQSSPQASCIGPQLSQLASSPILKQHGTARHGTAQHSTAQHSTAFRAPHPSA